MVSLAAWLVGSTAAAQQTIVSLTFDDGLADQYLTRALFAQSGVRATYYVNSGSLGLPDRLTVQQVFDLRSDGHEIGGHTIDHPDLTTISAAEATGEICDDRRALLTLGLPITSFAYPFGAYDAGVEAIVRSCGYTSARAVGGLVSPAECLPCPQTNAVPPANPYSVRTSNWVAPRIALSEMQQMVILAEDHGGGWVPLVFHHVCDACDAHCLSVSTLRAFLDSIVPRSARGVVRTVGEVIGRVPSCDPLTGTCLGCLYDGDCDGATPLCDTQARRCVSCRVDGDCPPDGVCHQGHCLLPAARLPTERSRDGGTPLPDAAALDAAVVVPALGNPAAPDAFVEASSASADGCSVAGGAGLLPPWWMLAVALAVALVGPLARTPWRRDSGRP